MTKRWCLRIGSAVLAAAVALAGGCGKDSVTRPPTGTPGAVPLLFHEPQSYCLPFGVTGDTLFLYNYGDTVLVWTPQSSPANSTGLSSQIRVNPGIVIGIVWTWAGSTAPPGGPGLDSLVVGTNDPDRARVVIPFERKPAGYIDVDPPPAPALALPPEGARLAVNSRNFVQWSRVSDFSGIDSYEIQIATDADFHTVVFDEAVSATDVEITAEDSDRGTAWWRVRARDASASRHFGPWSASRSWIVG